MDLSKYTTEDLKNSLETFKGLIATGDTNAAMFASMIVEELNKRG